MADTLDQIGALLAVAVGEGRVPGAVAVAGRAEVTLGQWVAGQADTIQGRPMRAGTVFDLASLTKVVATTTVTLALAGQGTLSLDDPVIRYLPEFAACRAGPVTLGHLLTHTAGLPAGRTFHRWCGSREELLADLYRTPLDAPPGSRVVYSDLGFIALGEVVAAVTAAPLEEAVRRLVTAPLAMTATEFNPNGPADSFAATERRTDGTAWTGTVHDENARLMDGVAGHAGLFAPAADLARFAAWWVSGTDAVVPAALRRAATACQTGPASQTPAAGRRGFGWACSGDGYDILGGYWPATSVSHTGFTGTSLALDPATGLWVVLLTNAVHVGRDAAAVQALRRAVHSAYYRGLLPGRHDQIALTSILPNAATGCAAATCTASSRLAHSSTSYPQMTSLVSANGPSLISTSPSRLSTVLASPGGRSRSPSSRMPRAITSSSQGKIPPSPASAVSCVSSAASSLSTRS